MVSVSSRSWQGLPPQPKMGHAAMDQSHGTLHVGGYTHEPIPFLAFSIHADIFGFWNHVTKDVALDPKSSDRISNRRVARQIVFHTHSHAYLAEGVACRKTMVAHPQRVTMLRPQPRIRFLRHSRRNAVFLLPFSVSVAGCAALGLALFLLVLERS